MTFGSFTKLIRSPPRSPVVSPYDPPSLLRFQNYVEDSVGQHGGLVPPNRNVERFFWIFPERRLGNRINERFIPSVRLLFHVLSVLN